MSGLSRTPGKRVWANPHRGFESRPLRHEPNQKAPSKALFCFLYHPFYHDATQLTGIGSDHVGLARQQKSHPKVAFCIDRLKNQRITARVVRAPPL